MTYREITPCPALRPFVRCYWSLAGRFEVAPRPQRIFPDGFMEMVFHFADPFLCEGRRQARALLAGQIWAPLVLQPSAQCDVLGVRFQPGGSAAFLRFAQYEVAGRIVSLEDVCGEGTRWYERLWNATDRFVELERLLLEMSPEVVMPPSNLSMRQYRRRFEAAVGISPKLLHRIQRFQRALRLMGKAPMAEVAAACGYFDQAHLIRDWKQFAGVTPSQWLRDQSHVLFFQDAVDAEGVV